MTKKAATFFTTEHTEELKKRSLEFKKKTTIGKENSDLLKVTERESSSFSLANL
jgi:hypothetical protein